MKQMKINIKDNWNFLSKRYRIEIAASELYKILQSKEAPLGGKFYGTGEYWESNSTYGHITKNGVHTLFLRPYHITEMPEEDIVAIYIDFNKYHFTENNIIDGLTSAWEFPIYIIKKDN